MSIRRIARRKHRSVTEIAGEHIGHAMGALAIVDARFRASLARGFTRAWSEHVAGRKTLVAGADDVLRAAIATLGALPTPPRPRKR